MKIKTNLDLKSLAVEASDLRYHHGYDKRMLMTSTQSRYGIENFFGPLVRAAAQEISTIRGQSILNIMVNKLPKNTYIDPHIDPLPATKHQGPLPRLERWHLPIITDPKCLLNDEHLELGYWHGYVKYWEWHDVQGGEFDRIHLLVDLDTPERLS